jgi:hypothetical protein
LDRSGLVLAGVLIGTLGCAGSASWWREGALGQLKCATQTRALYDGALLEVQSGKTLAEITGQQVVASSDCTRFATLELQQGTVRVVERSVEDGKTLRQGTFPYADRHLYGTGALLGDDVVLVGARQAYRLDLSTGKTKWSWQEPYNPSNRASNLSMDTLGEGLVGRHWVVGCDRRPGAEHAVDMQSLCVIDLKSGVLTEHGGYAIHDTLPLNKSLVAVLEAKQIRGIEVGPKGVRQRWVVPLDPQPTTLISSTLQVDGARLLVGTAAGVQVLDFEGRIQAQLALHEADEVALSGDWLVYPRYVHDLMARNLVTGEEKQLTRLSPCTYKHKVGLCGNFMYELDTMGPYAVVATRDRSAAFPLP